VRRSRNNSIVIHICIWQTSSTLTTISSRTLSSFPPSRRWTTPKLNSVLKARRNQRPRLYLGTFSCFQQYQSRLSIKNSMDMNYKVFRRREKAGEPLAIEVKDQGSKWALFVFRKADIFRKYKRENQIVLHGNNGTGREGKRRCETCRKQHRKVCMHGYIFFFLLIISVSISQFHCRVWLVRRTNFLIVLKDGAPTRSQKKRKQSALSNVIFMYLCDQCLQLSTRRSMTEKSKC